MKKTKSFLWLIILIFSRNYFAAQDKSAVYERNRLFLEKTRNNNELFLKNNLASDTNFLCEKYLFSVFSTIPMEHGQPKKSLFEKITPSWDGFFFYGWTENPYDGNKSWISKSISESMLKKKSLSENIVDSDSSVGENQFDTVKPIERPEILEIISKSLENEKDYGKILNDEKIDEISKEIDEKEFFVRNSNEDISIFSYENERMAFSKQNDSSVVVSSFENNGTRRYFDLFMRISKKEKWSIKDKELVLDSVQTFLYDNDSRIPFESDVVFSDFKKKLKYETSGKIKESITFKKIVNADLSSSGDSPKKDDSEKSFFRKEEAVFYKYNEDGKISEKSSEVFVYKENTMKLLKVHNRLETYEYKIPSVEPDYRYFENGVLRLSKIYSSEEDYVVTSFFDGGFSVAAYYEKGIHKKDIYFVNGTERRRKEYE